MPWKPKEEVSHSNCWRRSHHRDAVFAQNIELRLRREMMRHMPPAVSSMRVLRYVGAPWPVEPNTSHFFGHWFQIPPEVLVIGVVVQLFHWRIHHHLTVLHE